MAGLLLICGSVRAGSSNAAVLRTAGLLAPDGVAVADYDELAVLPHFNPDCDRDSDGERLPDAAARLRRRLGAAEALLFSTPEYAGALPGSLKNLLDWSIGGGEMSGKPVGWINCAWGGPTRAGVRSRHPGPVGLGGDGAGHGRPGLTNRGMPESGALAHSTRPATSTWCGAASR